MIHNFIHQNNAEVPNYDLSDREMYFEIYVGYDRRVCIAYCYDANYEGAVYLTSLDNIGEIAEIFDYCMQSRPVFAGHLCSVIENYWGWNWITSAYLISVRKEICPECKFSRYKSSLRDRFSSYSYSHMQGNTIAQEIRSFYFEMQEKIKYRLMDEAYCQTMQSYYEIAVKPHDNHGYYYQCIPIEHILDDEKYMRLCQDSAVRRIYLDTYQAIRDLYNANMTVIR